MSSSPIPPSPPAPRRISRRAMGHALGVVLALALAWVVFLAYRRPDLLLELSALSLC